MAIKTVKEESLIAIGDAIRAKTGKTDALNFPEGMVDAIANIKTPTDNSKLVSIIDGSVQELNEEDFGNATRIRVEGFYQCSNLETVKMSNSITDILQSAFYACPNLKTVKMSKGIRNISNGAFYNCNNLTSIRFEGETIPDLIGNQNPASFGLTTRLEVPGYLYDNYLNANYWGSMYKTQLAPYDKYVNKFSSPKSIFEYNSNKIFTISLQNYETAPEVMINISDENIVKASINEINNTQITISVSSLNVEGTATIEIVIPGDNDYLFTRQLVVEVYEELTPPSYTVEDVGTGYGFELNANGYYESTNQGKSSTFSYCKVNISNMMGVPVYFDCISNGENNYDFGLLSAVNTDLSKDTNEGVYFHSFKGLQSPNVQTIEYLDAVGDCYITVKYKKDGSGDKGSDSLQFKVRFGE